MSTVRTRTIEARRRAARRAESAGGVVFVVAMTIAVLAAVGMYALRAASVEIRTAGYERQNTQTYYLAEYGVLATAEEYSGAKPLTYVPLMCKRTTRDACVSLAPSFSVAGLSPKARSLACHRFYASEISNSWSTAGGQTPVLSAYGGTPSQPGSLGSAPVSGDFWAEASDPYTGQKLPGNQVGLCPVQVTVSSFGNTKPIVTGVTDTATATYASEGIVASRARITGGSLPCGYICQE